MAVANCHHHQYFTDGPRSRNLLAAKVSSLHREKELQVVVYDDSDSSDEGEADSSMNSATKEMPFEVCRRENHTVTHQTTTHSSASRVLSSDNLSPPPSSGSSHPPLSSRQSSPLLSRSKFQQHVQAARVAKKAPPPNFMDIPWYHPGMTRHVAESMLLSKNIPDGTYLLRNSTNSDTTLTMSVSYKTSVKHYRVTWDGKDLCFGLGKFRTISEFVEHFESQPIISGESGLLVYLIHPYPRSVKEFIDYEEPLFSEGLEVLGDQATSPTTTPSSLAINSKDGFLTKLGQHRKNWKRRWFRLFKNKLSYYSTKQSSSPLREINIADITLVDRDTAMGKECCFKLVTSYRTFFMFASSETEAEEWIRVLKWKLAQNTQEIAI